MGENALAVRVLEFTADQRQMIRDTFASGASDSEFAVLMEVARARNLNPILRQIHFVKRWDTQKNREVWSTQISIDGLRATAERTGKYDGQDEPEFLEEKGQPICCKVRVYKKGVARPFVGVAHWKEFVQTKKDGSPTSFWTRMPHIMLSKCAEALALRKAFPEDLSGLYTEEELEADVAPQTVAPPLPKSSAPVTIDGEAEEIPEGSPAPAAVADEAIRRIRALPPGDTSLVPEIRKLHETLPAQEYQRIRDAYVAHKSANGKAAP
jgi:phage recombination protein Bet